MGLRVTFTEDQIRKVVTDHNHRLIVVKTSSLGEGRQWSVYRVDTVRQTSEKDHEDESWTVRLRVPKPGDVTKGWPQSRILHDWDYRTDSLIWSTIYQYVNGVTAESAASMAYVPALASSLQLLHRKSPVMSLTAFTGTGWHNRLYTELHASIQTIHDALVMPIPADGQYAMDKALRDLEPNPVSLLHGDLSPRNLLVDESDHAKISGIIDWDNWHYGDYMHDLANWATFNETQTGSIEEMLRTYHGVDKPAPIHPALLRRFWLYFALISVNKLAHLHKLGYTNLARAKARVAQGLTNLS